MLSVKLFGAVSLIGDNKKIIGESQLVGGCPVKKLP